MKTISILIGVLALTACEPLDIMPNHESRVFEDMDEARRYQRHCLEQRDGVATVSTEPTLKTVTITCTWKEKDNVQR